MNLALLDEYVERGLLRKAEDEDLVQYNYSEMVNNCPNGELWDEITMFNRGNIYEKKTGNLIAKAMPKFMNLGQLPEDKQNELISKNIFNLTEKMDGCLGIIYKYKGKIRCNSRGGFNNYVTDKIKELLPKYAMKNLLLDNNVLNVEVISPETRIICNYGDTQDLYLITAYSSTLNWKEYDYEQLKMIAAILKMPIVQEENMTWEQLLEWQKTANYEHEGFVIRFPDNERVKIKSEDYLRIAKVRSTLCKHTIWKLMRNDLKTYNSSNELSEYLGRVPDEFIKTANRYVSELQNSLKELEQQVLIIVEAVKNLSNKELAFWFKDNPNDLQGAVFNYRNGKDINKVLIDMIEPEGGFEDTVKMLEE